MWVSYVLDTLKPSAIEGFISPGTVRARMGAHNHPTVIPSNAETEDSEETETEETEGPNPNYGTL